MARTPRPWYWKARQCWCVTIDGRRRTLARGVKAQTQKAAQKAFHGLMQKAGEPRPAPDVAAAQEAGPPTLVDLAARYQADMEAREARSEVSRYALPDFRRRIAGFVEQWGDTPAHELRPYMVAEWLDSRPGLGATSRCDAVGAVKGVTRWATRMGLIDADPLFGLKKPARPKRREIVMDARKARDVVQAMPAGPFRDLLMFLYQTGARPAEAMALEARHVDLGRRLAILPDHKTRRKTDKPRTIPLPPRALALVRKAMKAHPEGPIFRNTRGRPWNGESVNSGIRRLRDRAGLGNDFFAYCLRHGFATDALASGERLALVAEMMGHSSPRMLSEVYSHLAERTDLLTEAAARVRKGK